MLNKAQKNKIAPVSIFFLFYISRIVVTLTNIQSVSTGLMKTDMLISLALAMGLTIIISLPILCCCRYHKSPMDIKWLGFIYAVYFVFLAGINISRFSYFASTTLNPDSKAWIFAVVFSVCAFYGALLGIEGLSRFSAFVFAMLLIAVSAAVLCNIQNFEEINLYPVISNKVSDIAENAFRFASNSTEMVMLLCLNKRVNGYAVKHYVYSVMASILTVFILIYSIIIVLGDAAALQPFPLFSLFQMARIGTLERMDVIHISFWIFAIFVKGALLIYCASISVKAMKHKSKCIIAGAGVLAVSVFVAVSGLAAVIPPAVMEIPFVIFAFVIPLCILIFKKRNRGDELIEKF